MCPNHRTRTSITHDHIIIYYFSYIIYTTFHHKRLHEQFFQIFLLEFDRLHDSIRRLHGRHLDVRTKYSAILLHYNQDGRSISNRFACLLRSCARFASPFQSLGIAGPLAMDFDGSGVIQSGHFNLGAFRTIPFWSELVGNNWGQKMKIDEDQREVLKD